MRYMTEAVKVSNDSPVLLDRFLENAIEVDVDALADAEGDVVIGGIMEHIEQAGVHSGDSACSLPAYTLSESVQDDIRRQMFELARALNVVGLMNAQFALQGETVYLLEVNPRASHQPLRIQGHRPPACEDRRPLHGRQQSLEIAGHRRAKSCRRISRSRNRCSRLPNSRVSIRCWGPRCVRLAKSWAPASHFGEAFNKALLAAGMIVPSGWHRLHLGARG